MEQHSTGRAIVADIAAGKEWWRITARDVAPWLKTLAPSATEEMSSYVEWIGDPWDGSSDIVCGKTKVSGATIVDLLVAVRQAVSQLDIDGLELPSVSDVRCCLAGLSTKWVVAIDFDMGDFILPLCVNEWQLEQLHGERLTEVAAKMAWLVQAAASVRHRIARREHALRAAFEETVEKIGNGIGGLWLRMDPFPFGEAAEWLPRQGYAWCMIMLGQALKWEPVGSDKVNTVTSIRNHVGYFRAVQRRRATMLAELTATGSIGHVSEVARALIEERGLDHTEVVQRAIEARRLSRQGSIEFIRNGLRESPYMADGVLQASMQLGNAVYHTGRISVLAQVPETLALGSKGRPVADLVDHPVFRASGIKVSKAENTGGMFEIQHRVRTVAVEQFSSGSAPRSLAA